MHPIPTHILWYFPRLQYWNDEEATGSGKWWLGTIIEDARGGRWDAAHLGSPQGVVQDTEMPAPALRQRAEAPPAGGPAGMPMCWRIRMAPASCGSGSMWSGTVGGRSDVAAWWCHGFCCACCMLACCILRHALPSCPRKALRPAGVAGPGGELVEERQADNQRHSPWELFTPGSIDQVCAMPHCLPTCVFLLTFC